MDYRKILNSELRRQDCREPDAYADQTCNTELPELSNDCEFLLKNAPTETAIVEALQALISNNPDRSVMLVPTLPFLQTKLKITPQRLNELISDNVWIQSWLDYIKALQEVKIMELFGAGNMEDAKLKWLIWAILGEAVDLATARSSVSTNAETTLLNINKYGTDS